MKKAQAGSLAGVLLFAFFAFRYAMDFGTPAQGLALLGGASLSLPFNILAHELGHALVARLLGCSVLRIEIGKGPRLALKVVAGIRVDWRRYMNLGACTHYIPTDDFAGWKRALIALAGPLANLLLAVPFALLPMLFDGAGALVWAAACTGLAFSNVSLAVMNLAIWSSPDDEAPGGVIRSDGALILAAFRRGPALSEEVRARVAAERLSLLGRHVEAAVAYEAVLAACPQDDFLLCKVVHLVDRAEGPRAGLEAYRRLVASGPPRRSFWDIKLMQAYLLGNLAWLSVKAGDPSSLADADILAPLALAGIPASGEIQATMGALDVRRGRAEAGEPRLLAGVRTSTDPVDRADFCGFLAQARRARGDEIAAGDYEALARHLLA